MSPGTRWRNGQIVIVDQPVDPDAGKWPRQGHRNQGQTAGGAEAEGYSRDRGAAALAAYPDSDIPPERQVSVAGFMLEAFCDMTDFPALSGVEGVRLENGPARATAIRARQLAAPKQRSSSPLRPRGIRRRVKSSPAK